MAKKAVVKKPPTQQQLLAVVVRDKGGGKKVAKELRSSQQSVSAWVMGHWLPRADMQRKMLKRYGIPLPWVLHVEATVDA